MDGKRSINHRPLAMTIPFGEAPLKVLIFAEAANAALLQTDLTVFGLSVAVAYEGSEKTALAQATSQQPDVVVIDLDPVDGQPTLARASVLVRRFAETGEWRVIAMTHDNDLISGMTGLELGADDYVAKPISARELVARIRYLQKNLSQPGGLRPILIDPVRSVLVGRDGRHTALSPAELRVLETLLDAAGSRVSRDWLGRAALNRPLHVDDTHAEQLISSLRRKLAAHGVKARSLLTGGRQGYAITDPRAFRLVPSPLPDVAESC
jgi:DNA-binding response OmpR family regulator